MSSYVEVKSILDDIAKNIVKVFSLDRFIPKLRESMKKKYDSGLEKAEVEFEMNFVRNERQIDGLATHTFDLIKGITDEMASDVRQQMQMALLNNESVEQIKNRLDGIFKGDNPTRFRYEDRLRMIARTESNRAENMGNFEGAKQSGIILKKYLSVAEDERTSDICGAFDRKYGTEEQAIPMEEEFHVTVKGKEYREKIPPFHPNCFVPGTLVSCREGYKKIEHIKEGDMVLTHRDRYMPVYDTMLRNAKEDIFEIQTSQGKMKVTGEHPIMTNNGWKITKNIKEGDYILKVK